MRRVSVTRSVPGVPRCEPQHLPGDLLPGGGAREAAEAREAGAPPSPGVVTHVSVLLQLVLLAGEELKVLAVRGEAVLPGDGVGLEQRLPRRLARIRAPRHLLPGAGGPRDGSQCPRGFSVGG